MLLVAEFAINIKSSAHGNVFITSGLQFPGWKFLKPSHFLRATYNLNIVYSLYIVLYLQQQNTLLVQPSRLFFF